MEKVENMKFVLALTTNGAGFYVFLSNFALSLYLTAYDFLLSFGLAAGMYLAILLTFVIAKRGIKKMGYNFPFIGLMMFDRIDDQAPPPNKEH